jgi:hypothetical protein
LIWNQLTGIAVSASHCDSGTAKTRKTGKKEKSQESGVCVGRTLLGGKSERLRIRIRTRTELGKPTRMDQSLPMFENARPPAVTAAPEMSGNRPFDVRLVDRGRKKDRVRCLAEG